MVDSSFFIRHQRFGVDAFAELREWCRRYELLTCGMVRMEVMRGTRSEQAFQRYDELFSAMRSIPTTDPIWDLATELARTLERKGTPLRPQDSLVAAHALVASAAIITLDTDFRRVPDLTVLTRLPDR